MIKHGKNLEAINEKFSILKAELESSGKLGYFNIHKNSENLIKGLLNKVYGYKLKNLNDEISTAPGLDLGDKITGVAFQVTSERSSEKVNDTLNKVLKFGMYKDYPQIKIFSLLDKRKSYSISVETEPHFSFDPKKDIIDLNDVQKKIRNLEFSEIEDIYNYISEELEYGVSNSNQINPTSTSPIQLIDIEKLLEETSVNGFQSFSLNIKTHGIIMSLPAQFHKLIAAYNGSHLMKSYLPILNTAYQDISNSQSISFTKKPDLTFSNSFNKSVLQITQNSVRYQYANTTDQNLMVTNLFNEFSPLLVLFYFYKKIANNKPFQLEITVNVSTNSELHFSSNNSSIFPVLSRMSSYILQPNPYSFGLIINSFENSDIILAIENFIHGFVCNEKSPYTNTPFIQIDIERQTAFLEAFEKNIFIGSELE